MKGLFKRTNKTLLLVVAALLLVVASIGGTLAWLTSTPGALMNTFELGKVPISINETFDKATKSEVTVENTGNVPAYIRVALVPVWRDKDGNGTGLYADLSQCNYALNLGTESDQWTYNPTDNYYYYNSSIDAEDETENLIVSLTVKDDLDTVYSGKHFELQVLAQSIQAEGMGVSTAKAAFEKAAATTAP